jgi:hypothetical protein
MIRLLAPWGELQPVERDVLGFKSTFGKRPNLLALNTETITLKNEDFKQIKQHIETIGRFEDIPLMIQGDQFTADYVIRLRGLTQTLNSVTVSVAPRKGNLTFFERADALTFEALSKLGGINTNTYVKIPYVVVPDDLVTQKIITEFLIATLLIEIANTVKEIAYLVSEATNVLAPQVAILKAVTLGLYLATLLITLIDLGIQLKELYFPRLRYLKAMRDYDLIRQGCEFLGYTLESNLLENTLRNLATLPIPVTRESSRKSYFDFIPNLLNNDVFNYGYPTSMDTIPTLGSAISQIEDIYNAETHVYNGVVRIETRTVFMQNPIAEIPNIFNTQENSTTTSAYDEEGVFKRKLLSWQIDYEDRHTTDNFAGLGTERDTQKILATSNDLVNITGYEQVNWNFAPAKRKAGFSGTEKLVKGIFQIADFFINAIPGGQSSLAQSVQDRIGVMMISSETYSVTKKMWINPDGTQPANYVTFLDADVIYQLFHTDREVQVNDGIIIDSMPMPCTQFEFYKFAQNKYVTLQGTNEVVQLLEANYNEHERKAIVSYKKFTGAINVQTNLVF